MRDVFESERRSYRNMNRNRPDVRGRFGRGFGSNFGDNEPRLLNSIPVFKHQHFRWRYVINIVFKRETTHKMQVNRNDSGIDKPFVKRQRRNSRINSFRKIAHGRFRMIRRKRSVGSRVYRMKPSMRNWGNRCVMIRRRRRRRGRTIERMRKRRKRMNARRNRWNFSVLIGLRKRVFF